ncbi:metalloregulator ArsR/SmtB family transcription factor [Brevibacillus porteri]|uniref:ArsR family transcriptional regulator n=1 Tax=Brevibacillus porteri TaxID=2126350 RepID=A0ABX5FW69_9BACL|nr:metalloregulator ArsR/SmtB family transcription factor [Brevibacillus porteri]MED1797668.1 metalloregulator ArsR/SmtB family transcription factor [Brevibacillus porteri]MED2130592.1 metalloregulator ArsR/SmtB family transcription factor [Brevibacillus porteri]MED2746236.1 metalloregulator ArsR/SmtB family transcription factor [Brevibacillus porteri]MED2818030.1 metalloregulator ArsR/SmtB family transcription factor [Brevibacillus porteri]MED2895195.1 metalloregulator ArsR/SmtB family transc
MQLDQLVTFYKALGDPTRVRILAILANGPLHGQALAGKLGVTPPTITHHMAKLRDAGVVYERRDKNTIYFYLHDANVKRQSQGIVNVMEKAKDTSVEELFAEDTLHVQRRHQMAAEKMQVIRSFITPDGKLKQIPSQRKKKLIVFEYMVRGLEKGRKYKEQEINEYIRQFHEDYATIRREFIMNHYMYREEGIYELNPEEIWAKAEDLQ